MTRQTLSSYRLYDITMHQLADLLPMYGDNKTAAICASINANHDIQFGKLRIAELEERMERVEGRVVELEFKSHTHADEDLLTE